MVESKLDLEVNDIRCLEFIRAPTPENVFSSHTPRPTFVSNSGIPLLWYMDHMLTVRIIIKALARLSYLDNVERLILERVEGELMGVVALEQANTTWRGCRRPDTAMVHILILIFILLPHQEFVT